MTKKKSYSALTLSRVAKRPICPCSILKSLAALTFTLAKLSAGSQCMNTVVL